MARIEHIEYVTADEVGEDDVIWIAEEFAGLPNWDGRDFALLRVTEPIPGRNERTVRTHLTLDIEWARMLRDAQQTEEPITLPAGVVAEKMPPVREGWVFADLDHAASNET